MKRLYLIRGLPGSGKSTFAEKLALTEYISYELGIETGLLAHFEADQFFVKDGVYSWYPGGISRAHAECQENVYKAMQGQALDIIVSNTFTRQAEMEPYRNLAALNDFQVVEISLFDGGLSDSALAARNIHNVPVETIKRMRERWER
jgi:hypothetical protein